MPKITHFEIATNEPEMSKKFYEEVFGWKIKRWEGPADYWLIDTGQSDSGSKVTGGIFKPINDVKGMVVSIQVDSIEDYRKKIEDAGGKSLTDIMHVENVGYVMYCRDTTGNVFGITEFK
ncbi:MAG: VOC family protein [Candidatus Kapaibacterium sp.]